MRNAITAALLFTSSAFALSACGTDLKDLAESACTNILECTRPAYESAGLELDEDAVCGPYRILAERFEEADFSRKCKKAVGDVLDCVGTLSCDALNATGCADAERRATQSCVNG